MPSFHVLIATIGRPSLQRMLNSLLPQLTKDDHLTIVFDGHTSVPTFDVSSAICNLHQYFEPQALGFWGHGIRNKYAPLLEKTDFVMHADDDDIYLPNVFSELRAKCHNLKTLYIAKMKTANIIIPQGKFIKIAHIGTPNGIIPYDLNKLSKWENVYGGDGLFYENLARTGCPIEYLDVLIYHVKP